MKEYSDKLERVQRQAARWTKGQPYRRDNPDYDKTSVTKFLKELKWMELRGILPHLQEDILVEIAFKAIFCVIVSIFAQFSKFFFILASAAR